MPTFINTNGKKDSKKRSRTSKPLRCPCAQPNSKQTEKVYFVKIGTIEIEKTAGLAPMAGVADRAFREICKDFGCAYVVGEMVSSKGLTFQSTKSEELLYSSQKEHPCAAQIFGDDPATMAKAAQMAMEYQPDFIDINMGCPAPKVAGNGGGSALMKNPKLAGEITKAVVAAVPVPVTVKFRKGWDENSVNAVEFAKIQEESGASALCIHGRTRQQMYAPSADWDIIAQVKQAVSVPVMGNGDVVDALTCAKMYQHTGCDLVMIGRGAQGKPWVFRQIREYLQKGILLPEPSLEEKMEIMLRHIRLICQYKGERVAMREARKHAAWYFKGERGSADFRRRCGELTCYKDIALLAEEMLEFRRSQGL